MADLSLPEPVPWLKYHRALEQVDDARAELDLVIREKELLHQVACGLAFDAGRRIGELASGLDLAIEVANHNARLALTVSPSPQSHQ